MMVETILESSQDFGMSTGALPQWKRELLQRRAARSRPPAHPPPPPPPPPAPAPADEDEELRYGPGIVKRLQSRYLSLALRDAPRRRPSVLRRAASLEHLLDERPEPARPARAPRPASLAVPRPAPAPRRDLVKRARSVDALSRLEARDEPAAPPSPSPRAPPPPRAARPPRRPAPLLRDAERPPPDLVRSTLRKFESAPPRRAAPAARVSAVLRSLDAARDPEPSPRTPSPGPRPPAEVEPTASPTAGDEPDDAGVRPVSRAALDGIARAGLSVRYAFECPRAGSHPPPEAANPVLLGRARRIGVIRPMPARMPHDPPPEPADEDPSKYPAPRSPTPPVDVDRPAPGRLERREPLPAALVEPIPRPPPDCAPPAPPPPTPAAGGPDPELNKTELEKTEPVRPELQVDAPLMNGHATTDRSMEVKSVVSKIGSAGIERAWSGSTVPWAHAAGVVGVAASGARRPRAPPPAATSVVFNFSDRKEVPDYIENDGIILRNKRNRIKAGEPGVVVLRPEALLRPDSDSDGDGGEEGDVGPPSPCRVTFLNDNVVINGKSSMPGRRDRERIAKLKLQFDDSLTRTFEYPSETSLCEDTPPAVPAATPAPTATPARAADPPPPPQLAQSPLMAPLAANTHIASAALSSYTPSKTAAGDFELGVTRRDGDRPGPKSEHGESSVEAAGEDGAGAGAAEQVDAAGGEGDAEGGVRACGADAARSWSEARTHHTDLLF